MTGDQIIDGGPAASVRHVDAARAGLLPEQRGGEMVGRAGAGRREGDFARIFVQLFDQFTNVVRGKTGIVTRTLGVRTTTLSRSKSLCGSYCRSLYSAGLMAKTPIEPTSSV